MDATKVCGACRKDIDSLATKCPYCRSRQDRTGLYRAQPGKLLGGVCAALGNHFDVDVAIVRVVFAIAAAVSGGLAVGVYLMLWVMTPYQPGETPPGVRFVDSVFRFGSAPVDGQPVAEKPSDHT